MAHNYYPTYLWDNDRRISLDNPPFSAYQKFPAGADPNNPANYRQYLGKQYSPDLIMEQARQFVRANKDQPFFLYVPTTVSASRPASARGCGGRVSRKMARPALFGRARLPAQFLPAATYAAMVTRMDGELGRLIDLVRELGLEDRTMFVFTSDNGPLYDKLGGTDTDFFQSDDSFRGRKGSLYEGGIREPLVVRWKGQVPSGITSARVTGFEDWLPTLLDFAGAADATPRISTGSALPPCSAAERSPNAPSYTANFPPTAANRWSAWATGSESARTSHPARKPSRSSRPSSTTSTATSAERNVAAEHPDIVAKLEALMRQQHAALERIPHAALDKHY